MKLAVQLYTLRRDYEGPDGLLEILAKVKEIGFDGVEFAGYQGLDAEVLKARLDELGLEAVGTHISTDMLAPENLAETLAFHKVLGCKNIGVGHAHHSTPEDLENSMKILSNANEVAKKEGIKVYYHNHSSEFLIDINGKKAMDWLKTACYLELDTFWSFHAKVDTYQFMVDNADKIALIHIKDGVDGKPCALGEGDNDLKSIIKAAKEIGLEWMILENDEPQPNGIADITRSMKFLKENV